MDTKSKKFKYTSGGKLLCLLLAAVLFFCSVFTALQLALAAVFFGADYLQIGKATQLAESSAFTEQLDSDTGKIKYLAACSPEGSKKILEKEKKNVLDEATKEFTEKKLRGDGSDDYYDSGFYYVWDANSVLSKDLYDIQFEFSSSYDKSPEAARKSFSSSYDSQMARKINYMQDNLHSYPSQLEENGNLQWYAKTPDGKVYGTLKSMPSKDAMKAEYQVYGSGKNYAYYLNPEVTDGKSSVPSINDKYARLESSYIKYKDSNVTALIAISSVFQLLALAALIYFLCLVGHTNEADGPVTAAIDKVPNDIHLILSAGLCCAFVIGPSVFFGIYANTRELYASPYPLLLQLGFSVLFTGAFLFLAEWLASVCRVVKAKAPYWRYTVVWMVLKWIGRIFRAMWRGIKKFFGVAKYQPQLFKRKVIWITIGYVAINDILALCHSALILIIFNLVALYFILKYLRDLDRIIDASSQHKRPGFTKEDKVAPSLKELADNLEAAYTKTDEAVAQAVREEHTRTQLITNVSHDLKTPLTSLINYTDLLGRCNVTDPDALKYIDVLHSQSEKLKHLIEDLIEASKVSSGNVTLNKTQLNLSELTAQAIAEFAPEMEKNGNEIIFNEPAQPPIIFADGCKTYRILANLLGNAKKYSAPGTRVYVTVSPNGTGKGASGIFEIKNVSSEPLNTTPEELMERFTRGDESRTKEGNGLGLSIAHDLCALQGGHLKLSIDGDLFKATVILPCNEE